MTDAFEGSIIRCMRRLEELLRQMCQASKAIGNTELENKFAEVTRQMTMSRKDVKAADAKGCLRLKVNVKELSTHTVHYEELQKGPQMNVVLKKGVRNLYQGPINSIYVNDELTEEIAAFSLRLTVYVIFSTANFKRFAEIR
ncbi:uncharacterized protein LOC144638329 [Oculina patagonica]